MARSRCGHERDDDHPVRVVAANPGPAWHVRGTGDFYHNGHTDILWQHDNSSLALWDMNGATISKSGGGSD